MTFMNLAYLSRDKHRACIKFLHISSDYNIPIAK